MREDPEVSALVADALRDDGVTVLTGHRAIRCGIDGGRWIEVERDGAAAASADQIIVAVGRSARLEEFGLDRLGIETDRTIVTNALPARPLSHILAAGDVAGPFSSPMPHPTRHGSPARSTRCSAPSGGSGSMTA